jgi:arylsulfatase A-like enzyme
MFSGALGHAAQPNVIVILSDDVGYGDVSCQGATRISTPNIDKLAAEGLRFTDAHSTASTCTPSRYSLLTGSYAFRNRKAVILAGNAPLVIPPGSPTLPAMMKQAGYATGFVGKWHLGVGDGNINWNKPISPGPDEIGFDYSYYLPATPDRTPCVYIENHEVQNLTASDPLSVNYKFKIGNEPTGRDHPEMLRYPADPQHSGTIVDRISRIGWMAGGHSAWWKDEDMAEIFEAKAAAFVEQHKGQPFFLYYAPHEVHVPRAPNDRFLGTSQCGIRGDSMEELDYTVGKFMADLKRMGVLENTLIVFSSDNGPIVNDGYGDGSEKHLNGHKPAGPYRGGKYQIYEGGTRLPFIVYWPGKVAPGVSSALVSQVDLYASLADLVGMPAAAKARPDSVDLLPALLGRSQTGRTDYVEQSQPDFALREGTWKYILAKGRQPGRAAALEEGDYRTAAYRPEKPGEILYDLSNDPGEKKNVIAQHPEIAARMKAVLLARMAGSPYEGNANPVQ